MLLAEVNNPNSLRLTKSDTDGIFLHFDAGEKQVGIRLDNPDLVGSSVAVIWAEKQFAQEQPPAGEFTNNLRDEAETLQLYAAADDTRGAFKFADIYKICTRLDRSEVSRKELLTALEMCERARACGQIEKIDKIILQAAIKSNKGD